jgi:hypothetical protein
MSIKITAILIIALVAVVGALGIVLTKLERAQEERDQAVDFSNARQDSIAYLTTKTGQESAKTTVLDLTIRNLRRLQSDERIAWVRQFDGIKHDLRNLEQATRTTARLVAEFKIPMGDTTIILPDSTRVQAKTFDNHNEWFRLRGVVTADTLVATPEVTVPLESVLYWERPHKVLGVRYGRKKWVNETTSPNPYVKITKSEIIRVGRKKK